MSLSETECGSESAGRYERDRLLLQRYVTTRTDESFAALHRRYHGFVYAVCFRELRNPELAADATQVVFIALTQKAASIQRGAALSAWLFQAARLAARDLGRRERRRAVQEQVAAEERLRDLNCQNATWEEQAWRRIDPHLNSALARLSSGERLAVLLRCCDGLSLAECGSALGVSPDAARMRIHRALEKMRRHMDATGCTVSALALGELLAHHSSAPAFADPPALHPSGTGLHASAVKGVIVKMNLLIWKPVIAGLVGAGAALSMPVFAPLAVTAAHQAAPRTGIARSQSPARTAGMDELFADVTLVDTPQQFRVGTSNFAAGFAAQESSAPRLRTGSPDLAPATPAPPASGATIREPGAGQPGPFAIRYTVPVEQLSADARGLIKQLAAQTADEDKNSRTRQILTALRGIQKGYTSEGQLDEAVAVRQQIRLFKQRIAGILPDPGNLTGYRGNVGSSYLFSVVGKSSAESSKTLYDIYLLRGMRAPEAASQRLSVEYERLNAVERSTTLDLDLGEAQTYRSLGINGGDLAAGGLVGGAATVWGTDIYTDDSPLAAVAVHAGVLKEGEAGIVRVTIFAGKDEYDGSTRNGVTSTAYGPWDGSYMVEKAPPVGSAPAATLPVEAARILAKLGPPDQAVDEATNNALAGLRSLKTDAQKANKLDEALLLRDTVAATIAAHLGAMPDPGNLTGFRGHNDRPLFFQVTGRSGGSIWGSDTYTDDTDIGTAAVHAGLLKPGQTGVLQVTILPGQQSYAGGTRNGVASSPYAAWTGSYAMRVVTTY